MKGGQVARPRLLIEEWLPIAEIGIESLRERTPMTPFPAPNRLHVWWARRPLVASRAAILASLLPAAADRGRFLHMLGIHGDPMASRRRIDESKRSGDRFEGQAYSYKRAFSYIPSHEEHNWFLSESEKIGHVSSIKCLDPTAGGGSVPFEATRIGLHTIANDLNPVAWMILKATIEFPKKHGQPLLKRFEDISADFVKRRDERLNVFFPPEPVSDGLTTNWFWARTISCPYCGGLVPLSPNWRLNSKGTGVRLIPHIEATEYRHCTFEIVETVNKHSPGTVKRGDALCPYPDCSRVIDGDEVKKEAQSGMMGEQLYAVLYKQTVKVGFTKSGKDRVKSVRGYRAPRPEDDISAEVAAALSFKMPEWESKNIFPSERFLDCYRKNMRDCIDKYGFENWTDFFSPRQLLGHCIGVEVFQELTEEIQNRNAGSVPDLDKAALTYLAIALDKLLNYNSRKSVWMPTREVVANTFNRHDFSFCWSYSEMSPTAIGIGYDWTIEQTGKALEELIQLAGCSKNDEPLFIPRTTNATIKVTLGSGDVLSLGNASIDCIVIDPPYYDNVTYSELSDYFYVWLKRTVGLLFLKSSPRT